MKKVIISMALIFLILLVSCATEQKAIQLALMPQEKCDAPVWNIGDSWRFRRSDMKEAEYKVLGVEDFKNTRIYVVESRYSPYKKGYDVSTLELKLDITADGKKIVPMTDWDFFYDFPLYVGKKWKKMTEGKDADNNPRNYLFTYKVLSFENVTVPAGIFKAYKIEVEQRSMTNLGDTFVSYLWYSPEVKREVKYQAGPVSGRWKITAQDIELKSFKFVD